MDGLNDEDRKILEQLNKSIEEEASTPPEERQWVPRPERYVNLPGFDDEGNKFPVHRDQGTEDD